MSLYVDIEKQMGSFVLKVKFEAGNGTTAILGASGCGKSMTLRCIAGIEKPDRGLIILDGVTLFDSQKRINLSPQERHVGLMFQNYSLFPNMTVYQNIVVASVNEKDKKRRKDLVQKILSRFELTELASHYPHQLSGGQQQRVALARILISAPNIMMLDEPFSALDSHLKFNIEQDIREAIKSFGKTVLLVSHEWDEAYRLADNIVIMNNGAIDTCGDKKSLFEKPVTRNTAMIMGCTNISAIRKISNDRVYATDWGVELSVNGDIEKASYIGIYEKNICLDSGEGDNSISCNVVEQIENPYTYTVMLLPDNGKGTKAIAWEVDKDKWKEIQGGHICISLPDTSLMLLV